MVQQSIHIGENIKNCVYNGNNSANKRNGWKVYEDGLARPSQAITTWALQNAIHGKNKIENNGRVEYTRNIQPFLEDINPFILVNLMLTIHQVMLVNVTL